jgi:dTMP kinase
MFISLEGIDGSGKTTQAKLLAEEMGEDTVLVREPGGTRGSEAIRDLLIDPEVPLGGYTELLLFCAARSQLVEEVIEPALKRGAHVVADRFSDSSVAYQGAGRGVEPELIERLCGAATKGIWPDLTLLLQIDPDQSAKRSKGKDRFESEGVEFQRRVAVGYEAIAAAHPDRIQVVDASGGKDQVHAKVMEAVHAHAPG